jgi:putative peptidoglycan lipid II flippase
MSQANKIVGAAFLLAGLTIVSRLIGFVREQFIAYHYGTGLEADAFVLAFTIPTLILTIVGGALSAALIPMIVRLRSENQNVRLKQLISSMFSITSLIMLLLTVSLYFFIEPFVQGLYARRAEEDLQLLTIEMLKIIVPALLAIGLVTLLTSVLNAYKHYFVPALGPVLYSTGVIVATVFFSEEYGVESLMIGMAIGILAHMLIALSTIFYKKISFKLNIYWNSDLKQVGFLILPILISITAFQINTIVDRSMASGLDAGSIASLNYANRIVQLPLSLFVGSMVLPLFPMIAERMAKQEWASTNNLLSNSYRLLGILLLPVMGVFVVLSEPIIAVLFQRGEFDLDSVRTTSIALTFYAFTLLPFAMRDIMTRAFYSMQDTWTPVINSVILVAINIGLMLLLVPTFGMIGIAGSTSIASLIAYIRLRHILMKKLGRIQSEKNQKAWLHIWRNALVFTLITWAIYQGLLQLLPNETGLHLYSRTVTSFLVGGILYIILTLRLDTDEVDWLKQRVGSLLRKLLKRPKT